MWPVASWSSLESSGRWKMLHYFARSFFANVGVILLPGHNTKRRKVEVAKETAETVEVWVVNDTLEPISVSVNVELWDLSNSKLLRTLTLAKTVDKLASSMLAEYHYSDFCDSEKDRRTRFLHVSMTHSAGSAKEGAPRPRASNDFFFAPYKQLQLPKPP